MKRETLMRIAAFTLFALTTSVALVTPLAASSIVSDGGFEGPALSNCISAGGEYTGSLGDGWTVTSGAIAVFGLSCQGSNPHSGSQDVYLDFGGTSNTLSQTLATEVGQQYVVSYWVADIGPDSLSVVFGGQTLFSGVAPVNGVSSPSDYVNYSYTVTATSSSTNLSFTGLYTNTGYESGTFLDDVNVSATAETPEPASAMLMGGAMLGLLRLHRWIARDKRFSAVHEK